MLWIITRDARQGKTLLPRLPLNSSVKDFGSTFAVVNIKKTITVILFSRKCKTEMSRQCRDILVLGALPIWYFLLLDLRPWPQPCHTSSWIRPRSLRARSPLFPFTGAGGFGAMPYALHLALFNQDVSWDGKNNPEAQNKMGPSDQYKFYSMNVTHSTFW